MRYVVFEHDPEPDFSWLDQSMYNPRSRDYSPTYYRRPFTKANEIDADYYRDADNHVALCMLVYRGDPYGDVSRGAALPSDFVIDSLGNIDFLRDEDNWTTGTFLYVNDIPKRCRYQRFLAREAGLRYRPRRKGARNV